MKRITPFVLLWALHLIFVNIEAQNNQANTNNVQNTDIFYHTVESGQNVYSIAKMYDVMVIDIYKLNAGSENGIKAGERLKIPQRQYAVKSILNVQNDDDYIIHTIKANETIFGLSRLYNVSEDKILIANPGLSQATFTIGRKIRIPKSVIQQPSSEVVDNNGTKEVYYTVPSGETIYNICRRFKTTEAELLSMNPELAGGLRAGMTIRIILRIGENELPNIKTPPRPVLTVPAINRENMIRVALLLPVDTDNPQMTDAKKTFIEYYEGFLLAVDTLRKQGYSIELFLHEIGEDNPVKTRRVLQEKNTELTNVHLIIGGYSNEQVKLIADFAKQNKVKYVIPTSRNDEAINNAYVFQVNTPPAFLYEKVAFAGANLFAKHNIIFLDTKETEEKDDQSDFIKIFKQELKDRNISYKEANYDAADFEATITSILSTGKPNMIMPVSQSPYALLKTKTILRMIAETKPEYNLTLFGYPIWQTYTKDCLEDFHALNTYTFNYSYADNFHPGVKAFNEKFKNWYSKSPMPYSTKIALVAYDTGMYFINAIQQFGSNFEDKLSDMNYKSLQTGFNFDRANDSGGYFNKNIFIIHYDKDFSIIRSEFR